MQLKISSAVEEFDYQRSFPKWKRDLTHRFHVAVRLFSNRVQMTLMCGKNKEVHTRRSARVCHENGRKFKSVFAMRAALLAEKKSSEVELNIAGVERICSENLRLQQHSKSSANCGDKHGSKTHVKQSSFT